MVPILAAGPASAEGRIVPLGPHAACASRGSAARQPERRECDGTARGRQGHLGEAPLTSNRIAARMPSGRSAHPSAIVATSGDSGGEAEEQRPLSAGASRSPPWPSAASIARLWIWTSPV